jgi:hypothetical protein
MNILVSIDDTDNLESRGTGELASDLAAAVEAHHWGTSSFVSRHQLLIHPDVPYTSHNSAMCFTAQLDVLALKPFTAYATHFISQESATGSDPGLCIVRQENLAEQQQKELIAFGQWAKREVLNKAQAVQLAAELDIHLSELGGTGAGIIGALAGAGLRLSGNDGRLRGKVSFDENQEVLSVAEICSHPLIDRVKSFEGQVLGPLERVKIGRKIKTVFQEKKSILLVVPLVESFAGASWQTCPHKLLKSY